MKKKKRIVRVTYGYRLKSPSRKTRKTKAKKTNGKTVSVLEQSTDVTQATGQVGLRTVVQLPDTSEGSSESQVAEFTEDFNPYKAYLTDMMQSLSDIPSDSFVVEMDTSETMNTAGDVVDNVDVFSENDEFNESCLTDYSEASEHGLDVFLDTAKKNPIDNQGEEDISVNLNPSNDFDSKEQSEVLEGHVELAKEKPTNTINSNSKNSTAWLAGVTSCLLADKSRI